MTDSMREFERAISSASRYRHLHDEALAYERAANLHLAMGLSSMGMLSLTEAARRFDDWGARGKVAAIAHAHPELVYKLSARSTEFAGVVTTSNRELDVDAIVHSLQAVREETSLPRIVEILMTIALEQASAEIGELVLPTERGLRCRAYAYATAAALTVELCDEDAGGSRLPMSVIQAAIQRHVPIQIHDARETNEFVTEVRFSSGNVRSVLCLPLMRQAEVIGILYLENNVAAGAFTPARISLLQLLASTAAIAIENASLDEKSALLKEIHHRVKNNLQLISSLLSLQASSIEDASVTRLFAESRDRVRSMALVHENLYRAGNFARVSMAEHLRKLCAQLVRAYRPSGQQVDVDVLADSIELDINRAIACGLIVNELVSNALKHGFVDGRSGAVLVRFESVDRIRCRLHVIDNGVGMPVRHHSENTTGRRWPGSGIGMDLVDDLAYQLGGEVTVTTESGTSVEVCFARADNEG
jgi:two-component sensor histidine kinase